MATEEETRAAAYRMQAAARAAFHAHLFVQRYGLRSALVGLYARTLPVSGVKDIPVNEWEEEDEDTNEQIT